MSIKKWLRKAGGSLLRSRLSCEGLDDRICPTADTTFAFTLPNSDAGTGSFTLPASDVDRTQALQQISISDLTLTLDDETFADDDFVGGVTADFAAGVFIGLTYEVRPTATGFPYADVSVGDGVVQTIDTSANYDTAGVAYTLPTATGLPDTRFAFTLPNGDTATASFTMPIGDIDATQESQQITVGDLSVTLDGTTFTDSDFASGATADFASGVFQGVTFAVNSTPSGFAYTDLSVSDGLVTATDPTTGAAYTAPVYTAPPGVAVPQHTVTVDESAGTITVDGEVVGTYSGTEFTFFGETYTADPISPPPPITPADTEETETTTGRPPTPAEQNQLKQLNALRNQLMATKADILKQIADVTKEVALAEQVVQATQQALNAAIAKVTTWSNIMRVFNNPNGSVNDLTDDQRKTIRDAGVDPSSRDAITAYYNQLIGARNALNALLGTQQAIVAQKKQKIEWLKYDLAKVDLKLKEVEEAILIITTAALNGGPETLAPPWVFNPNLSGGENQTVEQALANQGVNKPAGYVPYTPTPNP